MRKPLLGIAALLLAVGLAPAADAPSQDELLDEYVDAIRGDLVQRRDASLRAILDLSEEEAKAFWPLQKQYDKERTKLGKERRKLLKEWGKIYQDLEPDQARDLAGRFFDLDRRRAELRQKYFDLMVEQVNAVVAAQFLQLQSQFETMGDLKLATYVPLAGS